MAFFNPRNTLAVLGTALIATFISTTASAQSSDAAAAQQTALDEILVTARKREERLQDIPTSAAALTADFLVNLNPIEDIRELTDLIPGITVNDVNLYFLTEPSIRGGGAGRNRYSASATGLYRNGAYVASAGPGGKNFARMDYFDMERAEVLRGPQGALYGRNALGGAINLISKKPREEFSADLTLRAGELDLQAAELIVNVPLGEQVSLRASHVMEDRDEGFYTDINGDYVDTIDYDHTRIAFRYQPADNVDIVYTWDRQDLNATPTIRISQSQVDQTGSEFETFINTPHEDAIDHENHNLNIDVGLEGGTLSFIANYRDRVYHAGQDADFWIAAREMQERRFSQNGVGDNQFAEIRYSADGSENFRWLIGADYSSYSNNDWTNLAVNFPIDTPTGLWFRTIDYGMDNWALFGMAEYTFDSMPLTLTGELRYAYDDFSGCLNQTRFNRNPIEVMRDFCEVNDWQNTPGALTASWKFEDLDALAYVKASSSYRHGGMNDGPGNEHALYVAQLSYDEETNLTYEIGWKQTAMDGRLIFNIDGFYGNYDEFIAGTDDGCPDECQLIDEFGNPLGFNPDGTRIGTDANDDPIPPNEEIPRTAFMDNVGEVRIWGYEAELGYRAMFEGSGGSLQFNLGYAKQKGNVEKFSNNVSQRLKDIADGANLIYTVPDQWKSQLILRQPFGNASGDAFFAGSTFVASATFVYESGGYWDLNAAAPNPMDTVRRLNVRFGIEADDWSLMINGQNITDEDFHLNHNSAVSWWRVINPSYWSGQFKYHFGN
jgi:iron complex outermembrane receptor protein